VSTRVPGVDLGAENPMHMRHEITTQNPNRKHEEPNQRERVWVDE